MPTTNLLLPFLSAGQAQKHVTVNESLRMLDGIVQLAVKDANLADPPASPSDGDRYIVPAAATGAASSAESASWKSSGLAETILRMALAVRWP